jgi:hypothetical protein
LTLVGALTAVGCSTHPPLPAAQRIDDRLVLLPVATLQACLRDRLDGPAAAVAGIAPLTTVSIGTGGVRIEQWFVTPATHQRTVVELAPAAGRGTRVSVYLLQRDAAQYRNGGFARAAVAAVDACAS